VISQKSPISRTRSRPIDRSRHTKIVDSPKPRMQTSTCTMIDDIQFEAHQHYLLRLPEHVCHLQSKVAKIGCQTTEFRCNSVTGWAQTMSRL
jgi:hypothetical protein